MFPRIAGHVWAVLVLGSVIWLGCRQDSRVPESARFVRGRLASESRCIAGCPRELESRCHLVCR